MTVAIYIREYKIAIIKNGQVILEVNRQIATVNNHYTIIGIYFKQVMFLIREKRHVKLVAMMYQLTYFKNRYFCGKL